MTLEISSWKSIMASSGSKKMFGYKNIQLKIKSIDSITMAINSDWTFRTSPWCFFLFKACIHHLVQRNNVHIISKDIVQSMKNFIWRMRILSAFLVGKLNFFNSPWYELCHRKWFESQQNREIKFTYTSLASNPRFWQTNLSSAAPYPWEKCVTSAVLHRWINLSVVLRFFCVCYSCSMHQNILPFSLQENENKGYVKNMQWILISLVVIIM